MTPLAWALLVAIGVLALALVFSRIEAKQAQQRALAEVARAMETEIIRKAKEKTEAAVAAVPSKTDAELEAELNR